MSREVLPSQMEMPFRNTPRVQGQLAAPPRPQQANHSQRTFNLAGLAPLQTRIDNGSAVEAMVMGMPVLDKIKLLSEISPPIKSVSPTSPKSLKGTLIAIEGEDDSSIMVCGLFLADILHRASECEVKSVEGPFIPAKGRGEVTIKDYLRVISDWHLTGAEVEKFLSTPRSPIKAPAAENEEQKSTVTERTVVPVPVAIIANYQLRTSNKFASCIPINDAYSPAFHWQWMATLWRGIIGPDLTIYIKNCGPEELSAERNVEIRDGYRCIVVRKDGEVKEIDDRTLRRLAFEVGEWVRNLAYGKSGTL